MNIFNRISSRVQNVFFKQVNLLSNSDFIFSIGVLLMLIAVTFPDSAEARNNHHPAFKSQNSFLQSGVVFPSDAGVIDVTQAPYNARGDGTTDDTAAIQAALNSYPNGNRIIYLPNGVYLVSNRLNWPNGIGGNEYKRTILQGQSRNGTIIKLKNNANGYTNPTLGKAVIWTGVKPAQRFRNAIRDLTVNTGSGNAGAIGIQFIANNQGGMRNVSIISGDGQGLFGLDMSYTDEIGPLLVRGLRVVGFNEGIRTFWQTASLTFENVTLENQKVYGWHNYGQTIFIRNLRSTNAVTALYNEKDGPSRVMLVKGVLRGIGGASALPAIFNQREMYLRDITTSGYQMAVRHSDKGRGNEPGVLGPNVAEWISHETPLSLFETSNKSLNLPVKETPAIAWGNLSSWVSPLSFGGIPNDNQDDTAAIQAAIDSGAATVYLPNGKWNLNGTLILRGSVKRLIGTESRVTGNGTIEFSNGTAPTVIIERLTLEGDIKLKHAAARCLILSSILGGRYVSAGSGNLFLDDVVIAPLVIHNQSVWARQLNQETDTQFTGEEAKVVNDGGQLWILGLKTERPGVIVKTKNNGLTEVMGAFVLSTGDIKTTPAFVNDDSSISLAGVWEHNLNRNTYQTWVEERRSGVVKGTNVRRNLYVGSK